MDAMDMAAWRIGIVEDDAEFRNYFRGSLEEVLSPEQVRTWSSAESFWRDENRGDLDILFIDIRLSHMNGIDLVHMLNERSPDPKKVILTSVYSDEVIFRALQAGAVGYLLKSELPDLLQVTRQLMAGGAIITPTIAFRVLRSFNKAPGENEPVLTRREKQILEQVATGRPAEVIARSLGITVNTMRTHVRNIYKKLNVKNKIELINRAGELGYI